MTPAQIRNNPDLYFHHSAKVAGYASRKAHGKVVPYEGRFGRGFLILEPLFKSTRYCLGSYYIYKEKQP